MSPHQRPEPALVLASASAARRALLASAGLAFEALPAAVDEAALRESARAEGLSAEEAALLLAEAKARRVASRRPSALVLGLDQILVPEGEERWFDKPESLDEAREALRALRGRAHRLATGIVAWREGRRVWQHVASPRLTLRRFSEEALEAHLAAEGEAALASVGAYRLEGPGVHLVERVEGEQAAVLGLPLLPLLAFLRQHGVLLP